MTSILPICGPVETEILVDGTGFPPSSSINLSLGEYLVSYDQVGTTTSSPNGTFQSQLTIPVAAQIGEQWVVISGTSSSPIVRSTSNIFIITPPLDPSEPSLYIVKPGDTLNKIALIAQRIERASKISLDREKAIRDEAMEKAAVLLSEFGFKILYKSLAVDLPLKHLPMHGIVVYFFGGTHGQ